MKRRTFLLGLGGAATLGYLAKPAPQGAPHDGYFLQWQQRLQQQGYGTPQLLIDRQRLIANCQRLRDFFPSGKNYRVVAKSLPSVPLLKTVMDITGSHSLMAFHEPFLRVAVAEFPASDILLGKPLPVSAAAHFYRHRPANTFNDSAQLQWLIDSIERLQQYLKLAQQLDRPLRVSLEIDVGLHRGGFDDLSIFSQALSVIGEHPEQLILGGLMGYDAQVGKLPAIVERATITAQKSQQRYREFVNTLQHHPAALWRDDLVLNSGGSGSLFFHGADSPANDLAAGSLLLKPQDFDLPALSEFTTAAFIATPVLKAFQGTRIPGPLPLGKLWQGWDSNRATSYFTYGGYWLASPLSPTGLSANSLYGHSTNQMLFNGSGRQALQVDDWIFFWPHQSEAVLLQFGDLLTGDADGSFQHWPVFSAT